MCFAKRNTGRTRQKLKPTRGRDGTEVEGIIWEHVNVSDTGKSKLKGTERSKSKLEYNKKQTNLVVYCIDKITTQRKELIQVNFDVKTLADHPLVGYILRTRRIQWYLKL